MSLLRMDIDLDVKIVKFRRVLTWWVSVLKSSGSWGKKTLSTYDWNVEGMRVILVRVRIMAGLSRN